MPIPLPARASVAPVEQEVREPDEVIVPDRPWVTIVWNDPVNLMSYVTFVFQEYFGYPQEKATQLMLDVHQKGRAVVSNGSREEMERDVEAMHGYGLWATMQKDD
ncbi:MAG: ATP-dependent Clp protease adapter ClpS [Actinomycetota bacterium]|nr:ATP-dependent Clp protease adapter ClpS [Actinomycetota bacterium]